MTDINTFFEIFYGSLLALAGIALVVNRYSWEQVLGDIEDNHAVVMLAGAFAFFVGLMTVTLHPEYRVSVALLTTIFGWLSLAKGVLLFITPSWVLRLGHFMIKTSWLHSMAIVSFTLGIVMLLAGLHVIG